jgi:iron complex outermembrane receptor protein
VLIVLLGVCALFGPTSVGAQQDATTPAVEAPPTATPETEALEPTPEGVESIAVTGERLDITDVQDEAQAITAFGAADLDKLSIGNVDGLSLNVPGLHVGQQGQQAIVTLRGVGTENASLTGEPGVAFHVDGINYGRPAAARVAFFDIKAIEVRRGPQGLTGGKNSTSGAIHVITNDPSTEYEIDGDLLIGNYDRVRARGVVNVPIGEFLATRLALFYEDRDGFLDNVNVSDSRDPFDADNFGLRGKLRIMPSDSLDIVLGYNYYKETGNGPQADVVPVFNEDPCDLANAPPGGLISPDFTSFMPIAAACRVEGGFDTRTGTFEPFRHAPSREDLDPRETYADLLSAQDDRYWGFSGKIDWAAPDLPLIGASRLKLLGGYQRTETRFDWDFDSVDSEFFNLFSDSRFDEYSSELQWTAASGERLTWQASLFFMRQRGDGLITSPQIGSPNKDRLVIQQEVENKSYGAALHGEYQLTASLTFSLGGRWIKDRKRSFLSARNEATYEACESRNDGLEFRQEVAGIDPPLPGCDLTDRGTTWGARLEWRPADDHLLYAGIDRGYKSGGFGTGGVGTYDPEKIWAYTLGSKSEFLDNRLQLNLEGFFYAYDSMQLALIDGTRIRTENTDARMYGWDLEMRAFPVPGLRLQGLLSFIDTETRDYYTLDPASLGDDFQAERLLNRTIAERRGLSFQTDRNCPAAPDDFANLVPCGALGDRDGLDEFSGNDLSRAPRWKFNISAEYDVPLGDYGMLTPRVQYAWQDETYYRVFNRRFDLQEDFHTTNLKLIWISPEERWEAEVFVNNVEDDAIKQNILVGPRAFGSPPLAWYSEPRFYGFRVGFRY